MSANLFLMLMVLILGLGVGGALSSIAGVRFRPPTDTPSTADARRHRTWHLHP